MSLYTRKKRKIHQIRFNDITLKTKSGNYSMQYENHKFDFNVKRYGNSFEFKIDFSNCVVITISRRKQNGKYIINMHLNSLLLVTKDSRTKCPGYKAKGLSLQETKQNIRDLNLKRKEIHRQLRKDHNIEWDGVQYDASEIIFKKEDLKNDNLKNILDQNIVVIDKFENVNIIDKKHNNPDRIEPINLSFLSQDQFPVQLYYSSIIYTTNIIEVLSILNNVKNEYLKYNILTAQDNYGGPEILYQFKQKLPESILSIIEMDREIEILTERLDKLVIYEKHQQETSRHQAIYKFLDLNRYKTISSIIKDILQDVKKSEDVKWQNFVSTLYKTISYKDDDRVYMIRYYKDQFGSDIETVLDRKSKTFSIQTLFDTS